MTRIRPLPMSIQSRAQENESSCGRDPKHQPLCSFSGSPMTIGLRKVPAEPTENGPERPSSSSSFVVQQGKMSANQDLSQKFNRGSGLEISADQEVVHHGTARKARPEDVIPESFGSRRSRRETFFEDSFNELSRLIEEYHRWCRGPGYEHDVRWNYLYDKFDKMKKSAEEYKAAIDQVE